MTVVLQSPAFDLHWEGALRFESPGRAIAGHVGVEWSDHGRINSLTSQSFASPDSVRVETYPTGDLQGLGEEARFTFQAADGLVLHANVRLYPGRPFALLRVGLTNGGKRPLSILRFFFRTLSGGVTAQGRVQGFYRNGWASWTPACFIPAKERNYVPSRLVRWLGGASVHNAFIPWGGKVGRFWAESMGAIVTNRETLVLGGVSLADQFVQVHADVRDEQHPCFELQSQADGVLLQPGETMTSEWFYLEWVPLNNSDPFAQYAYAVARQMNVHPTGNLPIGWCSWYMYFDKITEAEVIENVAQAALLQDELPIQIIQLDQGFEAMWGDWLERKPDFPHDLGWLARRIKGSGFTPGLWLAPFTVHPKSRIARTHPDWLLRSRRGGPLVVGLISNFMARALDPTHPEVNRYLHDLITTVVHEWGYRYLKLDFLYAAALNGHYYDPRFTRAQAYRHAVSIIRQAAGQDTFILGCGAPLGPSIGLFDAMRIGPDTAPSWKPLLFGAHWPVRNNPAAPGLQNSLHNVLTRAWMHGRWWLNDPDAVMVRHERTELTLDEVRLQATLIGLSGGLLMLSDSIAQLPPDRRAIFTALWPPLVEGLDALDLLTKDRPELAVAPMVRTWGRWRLVALINWGDTPQRVLFPETLLGLEHARAYHLVDFWERRYQRLEAGKPLPFINLPPHGVALLGLRPVTAPPQLVATTFHISMGGEIPSWEVGENEVRLNVRLDRVAEGQIWLSLPARPVQAWVDDEPLSPEKLRSVAQDVWSVDCTIARTARVRVAWATAPADTDA